MDDPSAVHAADSFPEVELVCQGNHSGMSAAGKYMKVSSNAHKCRWAMNPEAKDGHKDAVDQEPRQ